MQKVGDIYEISVNDIHVDYDWNIRDIRHADFTELERAIKGRGQDTPGGVVRCSVEEEEKYGKKYFLVYGFKRFYVIKERLKLPMYKCEIKEAATDEERRKLNWSENSARSNLNIYEESKFIDQFLAKGWSEQKIMDWTNQSRSWIQPRCMLMRLVKLYPELIDLASSGKLTQANIRDLNSIADARAQLAEVQNMKRAADLNIKIKIDRNKHKTKRDRNTMKFERTKPMRHALMEHAFGNDVPIKYWGKMFAWVNGDRTDTEIMDLFEEMVKDVGLDDEFAEIIENLDSYSHNTERLFLNLIAIRDRLQAKVYIRPNNGFPEKS